MAVLIDDRREMIVCRLKVGISAEVACFFVYLISGEGSGPGKMLVLVAASQVT